MVPVMVLPGLLARARGDSSDIGIRGVSAADAHAIAELCTDSFFGAHTFSDGPVIFVQRSALYLKVLAQIRRRIRFEDGRECKFLVAADRRSGAIAGCVDLAVHLFNRPQHRFELTMDAKPAGAERSYSWTPYVASLAVREEDRRKGIARQLMRAAERTSRAWGYRELMLEVACTNEVALRFYKRQGFRVRSSDQRGTGREPSPQPERERKPESEREFKHGSRPVALT